MKLYRVLLLGLSLFVSAVSAVSAVDSTPDFVNNIRVLGSGTTVVVLKNNSNGCGGNSMVIKNTAMQTIATSMAMTAIAAGKKVKAKYVVCSNSPWTNTATVHDLTIYN